MADKLMDVSPGKYILLVAAGFLLASSVLWGFGQLKARQVTS